MRFLWLLALLACGRGDERQEWTVPDTDLIMLALEAGSFVMGSPESEIGRGTDEDLHTVTLSRGFWMGIHEVTQGQFESVMGYNPATASACEQCPVETLNWSEAAGFTNALSDAEGLDSCYRCSGEGTDLSCEARSQIYECTGYRLPTEAEWEMAARSGTSSAFSSGGSLVDGDEVHCDGGVVLDDGVALDDWAWTCGNAGEGPQPVGSLAIGPWGFHDMHGNLWEMTHDWYQSYSGDETDPEGASTGSGKVVRGGSWADSARFARSAARSGGTVERKTSWLGFRIARSL